MSSSWHWPGSRWWRLDLHTHSPASYDFGSAAERANPDYARWVAAARGAGLDAVALTDHNTPDGIAAVQAAAAGTDLTVFPGVELTVGGIHLLCIFGPETTRDSVVAVLGQLGVLPEHYGRQDATSRETVEEAARIVADCGGLLIAAHVNGPNGVLADLKGRERIKVLACPEIIAGEVGPMPAVPSAEWLDPNGSDVRSWLDGSNKEIGRAIADIACSDAHALADLGRRFTWVKMTRPDLDGLRLALSDGDGALRKATAADPGDPNKKHAAQVIESIRITAARYMGKPDPLAVEFNPWLNAIIGGRGTGKSTLVDLLRLALRREAELGGDGEDSLRTAFDRRMRVPAGRADEGLLTESTLVEVTYRKDGERFVVSWSKAGRPVTIERLDGDVRVPEEGEIRQRFPVRIYGQKQLFELARSPAALLDVIDDAPSVGGADLERRAEAFATAYLAACSSARALRAQAAQLGARRAELADLKRTVEALSQGGHAAILGELRARQRHDGAWASIEKATDAALLAVEKAASDLVVSDLDTGAEQSPDPALASLRSAHAATRAAVDRLRAAITGAIRDARADLLAIRQGSDLLAWRAARSETERAYNALTTRLREAGIANPDNFRDLLQRSTAMEQDVAALESKAADAMELERTAHGELEQRRALRATRTSRRQAFAEGASNALIRVEVGSPDIKDLRDDFRAYLRQTLGLASPFDEDHEQLTLRALPDSLGAPWSYGPLDSLVAELKAFLADTQRSWPARDKRFETALRKVQPERLDRLALYSPPDAVRVSFRQRTDGNGGWRPIEQGSPGQKTAALLAFVLGYGDEPIVLDQPEDDLDSTLIYDLVVKRLRDIKPDRQVIVVTHNPNIVVHGDAELVVSLRGNGGQSRIAKGGLQESSVRDEICRVMEGGKEAFDRRYARIASRGGRRRGD